MTSTDTLNLILSTLTDYGVALIAILGAVIGIGLAYLVFRFGWQRIAHDQSLMIGGFYVRNTPYKGYNRWRSRSWNIKNTMP